MKLKILRGLRKINSMHFLCDHLFGEEHTHRHRMMVGAGVMFCGVAIASAGAECHYFGVHFLSETIGYLVHGIGAVPYAESMVALVAAWNNSDD